MDVSKELRLKFRNLKNSNGEKIDVGDVDKVIQEFMVVMKKCMAESDSNIYKGIQDIGDKIQETKKDIAAGLPDGAVADATVELDAVVKSTEEAANKIMDAAERIQELVMASPDKDLAGKIIADISRIFEACNFQDLTGQRIKKVTNTLSYIEKSVGGMLTSFSGGSDLNIKTLDKRPDAELMNGPQADSDVPSQDDVDKLFDSA